jgi:hypothetical protein
VRRLEDEDNVVGVGGICFGLVRFFCVCAVVTSESSSESIASASCIFVLIFLKK